MQEKSSGTFFMPEKAGPWSYVDRVMLQGPEFSKSPADKSSDPELAAQLVIPGFGIVPGVPAYPAPSTILKQESYVLISLWDYLDHLLTVFIIIWNWLNYYFVPLFAVTSTVDSVVVVIGWHWKSKPKIYNILFVDKLNM